MKANYKTAEAEINDVVLINVAQQLRVAVVAGFDKGQPVAEYDDFDSKNRRVTYYTNRCNPFGEEIQIVAIVGKNRTVTPDIALAVIDNLIMS